MPVSLAVSNVAAAYGSQPESVDQLLGGDVSPALGDVAFVFAFIIDNRFFISVAPFPASSKIRTLDAGMSKLGIGPDDIDLVILTHLHFDHVAGAHQFPKARLLIQRDELEFAKNPHPAAASAYSREFFEGLNFEVISGDTRICEEVSTLSTPGHSPGGQSVSIKTAQGTAIIASLCTIWENFKPTSPMKETTPVIAPGIHTNHLDAYDSLLRIKDMADIVVPLHDPEFQQKSSIP